jgi:hypothetical protein
MTVAAERAPFESTNADVSASAAEALAGLAAVVLTILGLAHVVPIYLVAIATIAVGVALILQGLAVALAFAQALFRTAAAAGPAASATELGGGSAWSLGMLTGIGGIVLGILALLQLVPAILVAIATIGYGGALVLTGSASSQVMALRVSTLRLAAPSQQLVAGVLAGSTGVQAIVGLQAIALGILAIAGFVSVTLVLIALLVIGAFIVINGAALSGMILTMFRP